MVSDGLVRSLANLTFFKIICAEIRVFASLFLLCYLPQCYPQGLTFVGLYDVLGGIWRMDGATPMRWENNVQSHVRRP